MTDQRIERMADEALARANEAMTLLRERGPKREEYERRTNAELAQLTLTVAGHENRLATLEKAEAPQNLFLWAFRNPWAMIASAWLLHEVGINPVDLLK